MDPSMVRDRKRNRRFLPPKKRYRKLLRNNIDGITRPALRRLARRGGVVRIKKDVYAEVRRVIKDHMTDIMRHVINILDSATTPRHERKVVTNRDVVFALNRMGKTLYGFD
ncbi:histone H4.2 [Aspergillus ellipticus CBS 707.79]|uniref:Histone H4 n=1 Tax=Aspergillus ellipticus CBS 707.79 TaxID=1448320 RepID=A0A319E6G1_9EURO|nr:histone H4.2 [Aspergillus ellipticus CBS 707.79]